MINFRIGTLLKGTKVYFNSVYIINVNHKKFTYKWEKSFYSFFNVRFILLIGIIMLFLKLKAKIYYYVQNINRLFPVQNIAIYRTI